MTKLKQRISRRGALGRIGGAAVAGALGHAAAHAQSQRRLTLGIIGPTVEYYPIFVAQAQGFFEQEGVTLDLVMTGGSANSAQMGVAGAINIGSSSWIDTIRSIAGGAPLVIVANSLVRSTTMMLGAKDIKSVADLKGKRVSVGGAKDITMVWWAALAQKAGLNPTNDVEVIYGGGTPARFAALAGGAVQAAAVATPLAFTAIEQGYTNLGVLGPLLPNVPYMTWHANRAWAEANGETITRYIRAHSKAVDFIYDPANRQKAAEILAASSKAAIAEATRTHDLVVEIKGFNVGSTFSENEVKGVLDVLAQWRDVDGSLPPGRFIDARYLNAAGAR
jgi:ABC-type nitrate/sulfonate/bicarbonate transport system substrate-binding protein